MKQSFKMRTIKFRVFYKGEYWKVESLYLEDEYARIYKGSLMNPSNTERLKIKDLKLLEYIVTDKNGIEIYPYDEFNFKYLKNLNETIDLKGYFVWNNNELCYEINIIDNPYYTCLNYSSNENIITDIEVTGNIHQEQ